MINQKHIHSPSRGYPFSGRWADVVCALLTILISGNPAIYLGFPEVLLIGILIIYYLPRVILNQGRGLSLYVMTIVWFVFIFLIQALDFRFFPIITILGFFVRMFIGFSFATTLKNPVRAYIEAMCIVVGISFLFYIPHQAGLLFGVDIKEYFSWMRFSLPQEEHFHIIVHNFHNIENQHRNAGLFWEPGAFAGYIAIAVIFWTCQNKSDSIGRPWKNAIWILMLGLLSTQSTTGYLVIPLIFMIVYYDRIFNKKRAITIALRLGAGLALMILCLLLLLQIPWVGEKFINQMQASLDQRGGWAITRFGSFLLDLQYIVLRPLTGWGLHGATRYMLHPFLAEWLSKGQGNGLTGFIAKTGFMGMGWFLYFTYRGFSLIAFSKGKAVLVMAIVLMSLFGEYFLNFPLYLGLMFLGANGRMAFMPTNNTDALGRGTSAIGGSADLS